LLIRHSKYCAVLSKNTSTDCFFDDFAHWIVSLYTSIAFNNSLVRKSDIEFNNPIF